MSIEQPSRVKILFDDGVCEEVSVSFVGECLCRLEETPMASTTEARFGDVLEFEPEDGIAKMKRIAESSCFEMLTISLPTSDGRSEMISALVREAEAAGCRFERAYGGTLLVHVPPGVKQSIRASLEAYVS